MVEQEKFSKIRFKVHKRNDQRIEQQFPGLFKWKEFDPYKRPSKYNDLCYLIFLYDPNSELIEEFPELPDRKDAAATEAGFKRKDDGEWPAPVQRLMKLEDQKAIPAVLRYLKICHNPVWREIVTLSKELDDMYEIRMQPVTTKDNKDASEIYKKRADLAKICDEGVKRLNDLYKEFFDDNSDLREETEYDLLPITPETAFKIFKPMKDAS